MSANLTRHGIIWRVSENDRGGIFVIPWWLGYVRAFELVDEFAPIPLNLVLAWWHRFYRGIRWAWAPRPKRMREERRKLLRVYRAGYEDGAKAQRYRDAIEGLSEHEQAAP